MKKLLISTQLSLPADAVVQKIAFIGRTGSGKSFAAGKMVEEMLDNKDQVIILDPVGIWYGLRIMADGVSPGFKIPVFGGLKGDVPLEPTAGALIADLVVDRGISAVLDVSQFESDADKARFARDWADRFYFRKKASPSAVHVVIEEAQEFIAQNPQKGEEKMLHAFQRMWKLGRNFGIGGSLISQRPQEVSKKALNQTELLFAFQMTGPQERKAIELWMSEKGIDTDIVGELPGLKVGSCYAWSPQWLKTNQVIHISPKKTFNSSSTPVVGSKARVQILAPIDLEELRGKMSAAIERAKENDPQLLKDEVRKLKKQIALAADQIVTLQKAPPAQPTKIVEVSVIKSEDTSVIEELLGELKQVEDKVSDIRSRADTTLTNMEAALEMMEREKRISRSNSVALPKPAVDDGPVVRVRRVHVPLRIVTPGDRKPVLDGVEGTRLGKAERTILAVLNEAPSGRPSASLALLSGYTVNGHFNNIMGGLRSAGLVAHGQPAQITAKGIEALGTYQAPMEGKDLQQFWLDKIGQAHARILKHLLEEYPRSVPINELAEATGYTVNGHFNNVMGSLRTAGLVSGRGTGQARACSTFFGED